MKSITIYSIRVFSAVSFIVGVFMIIAGVGAQHDFGYVIDGLCVIMGCSIALGFSYVVEAACRYIVKCELEDLESSEEDSE